eukprot:m.362363 g.362363  ORF g.362363 m.362363 type:complete len:1404 (+) comp20404_c0_seq1:299-4510(+)
MEEPRSPTAEATATPPPQSPQSPRTPQAAHSPSRYLNGNSTAAERLLSPSVASMNGAAEAEDDALAEEMSASLPSHLLSVYNAMVMKHGVSPSNAMDVLDSSRLKALQSSVGVELRKVPKGFKRSSDRNFDWLRTLQQKGHPLNPRNNVQKAIVGGPPTHFDSLRRIFYRAKFPSLLLKEEDIPALQLEFYDQDVAHVDPAAKIPCDAVPLAWQALCAEDSVLRPPKVVESPDLQSIIQSHVLKAQFVSTLKGKQNPHNVLREIYGKVDFAPSPRIDCPPIPFAEADEAPAWACGEPPTKKYRQYLQQLQASPPIVEGQAMALPPSHERFVAEADAKSHAEVEAKANMQAEIEAKTATATHAQAQAQAQAVSGDVQSVDGEVTTVDSASDAPVDQTRATIDAITALEDKITRIKALLDQAKQAEMDTAQLRHRRFLNRNTAIRLYLTIARKDVGKNYRAYTVGRANVLANAKKVATEVQKEFRKRFVRQSAKRERESLKRAKKLSGEMVVYWRRNAKTEREKRRKAEREYMDQLKKEQEMREARQQQRKFNFLLTQTELYAHFMQKKVNQPSDKDKEAEILKKLAADEPTPTKGQALADDEEETTEEMQQRALQQAQNAFEATQQRTRQFDSARAKMTSQEEFDSEFSLANPNIALDEEIQQPKMLRATLKEYQLKGLRWLANLYSQGINGILADEMGLGKTIQSISTLAHLAEAENIWGPFLVVTPASTLNNWCNEISKFCPEFRVIPYWGNPDERKILRGFWKTKHLYTRAAEFHVMVTSYDVVVRDAKFINKLKWQYMILDEAQAIKSSRSNRWNVLLKFNCRNRLLLTGTPIQNTMAELWALLHFIMPTLFDSHAEFNQWFSKDIESHAANSTNKLDREQLSRLHLILKPFMLRRVKKNVEHELPDKREVMIKCGLSLRQQRQYKFLRHQVTAGQLKVQGGSMLKTDASNDQTLLNLVMQFRKVCNHPDLLRRRVVRMPFLFSAHLHREENEPTVVQFDRHSMIQMHVPRLIYNHFIAPCHSPGSFPHVEWLCRWKIGLVSPSTIQHSMMDASNHTSVFRSLALAGLSAQDVSYTMTTPPETQLLNHVAGLHSIHTARGVTPELIVPDCMKVSPYYIANEYHDMVLERAIAPCPTVIVSTRAFEAAAQPVYVPTIPKALFPSHSMYIGMPSVRHIIEDCAKLKVLQDLLFKLKVEGHRVLIYSQMTKMIDLLEIFLTLNRHRYLRLDGSSKISDRRDMVADFQSRSDIFAFILSTRAGGIGINLTAADTVIFYDSDWNPTIDQQAMDRAHRLGQTRQVTVYRLITRNTIEEKILARAQEKSKVHQMVIQGGNYAPDKLNSAEVASLLLDEIDDPVASASSSQPPTKQDPSADEADKLSDGANETAMTTNASQPVVETQA